MAAHTTTQMQLQQNSYYKTHNRTQHPYRRMYKHAHAHAHARTQTQHATAKQRALVVVHASNAEEDRILADLERLRKENDELASIVIGSEGEESKTLRQAAEAGAKAAAAAKQQLASVQPEAEQQPSVESFLGGKDVNNVNNAAIKAEALPTQNSAVNNSTAVTADSNNATADSAPDSAAKPATTGINFPPPPATKHPSMTGMPAKNLEVAEKPRAIVFVASEAAPFSKTGGLGDVAGALPRALAARGHRVMVVSPRYQRGEGLDEAIGEANDTEVVANLVLGTSGAHDVRFFHTYKGDVDWVFADHLSFQRPGTLYGDEHGTYGDNQFRFALLSLAACEAALTLPLPDSSPDFPTYGEDVVFIANDWHASLVPIYIASKYRPHGVFMRARSLLVIHNLMHQGIEPSTTFETLGVPGDWYPAVDFVFPEHMRAHELDKGECVNLLKGAIATCDRIVTVSTGFAWEITTPEGGFMLDHMLRSRQFQLGGVTNGIDEDEWNPADDPDIEAGYDDKDMSGKATCKAALQRELGLPEDQYVPLVGFIGRLDPQKGPDLVRDSLDFLVRSLGCQVVVLGSGLSEFEEWMRWAETEYPSHFRGHVGFSVQRAHRITAGVDILLMPSRFEPCGLNQLYAMRYGTVPVVHATGGLRDTVEDYNPFARGGTLGSGTGWTFAPPSNEALQAAMQTAVMTYREHPDAWKEIMRRGMRMDHGWREAARQYEQIVEWTLMDPPYA